jgi:hypothetical protein
MHDRPPGRSVGFQEDNSPGDRPSNQIVEDDIETDAGRDAVRVRRAHPRLAHAGAIIDLVSDLGP